MRSGRGLIIGIVLASAFVASCFVWGPFGSIFYVGGLFNSSLVFMLDIPLFLLILLAAVLLPVLVVRSILRWRGLSVRERAISCLLIILLASFVVPFGLGFAGMVPGPFDMFARGFARYAERRTDVTAIQDWLGTLDPKEYAHTSTQSGGIPVSDAEYPRAIALLHPIRRPHGVRIGQDNAGRLMVRLMWGGGFIGHWGIEVGDASMELPRDSEGIGYQPLAPGAWVWYKD